MSRAETPRANCWHPAIRANDCIGTCGHSIVPKNSRGGGCRIRTEAEWRGDIPRPDARPLCQLATASPILTAKLTNKAYGSLPCAYLVLERDLTLSKEYQEQMAALQGGKTRDFKMYHCPAGHSPHLSWTNGIVDTVMDFVNSIST
jgi:hypothetical protein